MKFHTLCVCIAAACTSTTVTAGSASTFPKAVQGIWMSDDGEGREQCRKYLAATKQDGVDASDYLVGAEIISVSRWHSYAEYGEGNSYEIQSLQKLKGGRWRFSAITHVDGAPAADDNQPMVSRVKLDRNILTWTLEGLGGNPVDSWDEHRYFRCASVPAGFYAS